MEAGPSMDKKPGDVIPVRADGRTESSSAASNAEAVQITADKTLNMPMSPKSNVFSTARSELPPGTSLAAIFRYHMGIENDGTLVPSHLAEKRAIDPIATGTNKGRRAVNLGIYNRAIREERTCAVQYQVWSLVINLALGLQIIFAAILTALGAAKGPPDVVAVFGTLNTIIAGFLTYLKGTGLPMRMKYFHNQWLKLRAYIEQRERDFASDDFSGIHHITYQQLLEEIEIVEAMYHNIRKDIERHTPDNFGGGKGDEGHERAPGEGQSLAALAKKGLHAARAKGIGDSVSDPTTTTGEATTSPVPATSATTAAPATHGVPHMLEQVENRIKGAVEDVEKRMSSHLSEYLGRHAASKQGTKEHDPADALPSDKDLERGPNPSS